MLYYVARPAGRAELAASIITINIYIGINNNTNDNISNNNYST